MLRELGQREQALSAAQEAVSICRRLTTAHPGVFDRQLSQAEALLSGIQGPTL
jgi:hypothetical protein